MLTPSALGYFSLGLSGRWGGLVGPTGALTFLLKCDGTLRPFENLCEVSGGRGEGMPFLLEPDVPLERCSMAARETGCRAQEDEVEQLSRLPGAGRPNRELGGSVSMQGWLRWVGVVSL